MSGANTSFDSPDDFVFIQPQRRLGTVIPNCAIEERHSDRLELTRHPVEQGANISDHAYMLPMEVTLRYGFTDAMGGYPGFIEDMYTVLRSIQVGREPFSIVTGKRVYQNMMLTEIEVPDDAATDNVLMVTLHCQEVILVTTKTAAIGPANTQGAPEQTNPVTNTGMKQATPVSAAQAPPQILTGSAGLA